MNTYRVVNEKTLDLLTENVNDMVFNGWRPKGGILATYNQDKSISSYMQALVMADPSEDPAAYRCTYDTLGSPLADHLESDFAPFGSMTKADDYRKLEWVARQQDQALRKTLGHIFTTRSSPHAPILDIRMAIDAFEKLNEDTLPQ